MYSVICPGSNDLGEVGIVIGKGHKQDFPGKWLHRYVYFAIIPQSVH